MKLIGITRVRNEELIIDHTLDHVSHFVDSVVVYDDCSTDDTPNICECHPIVTKVIRGKSWDNTPQGRSKAEGTLRQIAYLEALKQGANYVYCFDADEYLEFDLEALQNARDGLYFRLFDFYITPEDVTSHYLERKYMGREYRDIPMIFKATQFVNFKARIPYGIGTNLSFGGYVKHYGKAISVNEWDKTCDYYINHRWKDTNAELLQRWKKRVGKAIHIKSDFGTDLITWDQRFDSQKIIKI